MNNNTAEQFENWNYYWVKLKNRTSWEMAHYDSERFEICLTHAGYKRADLDAVYPIAVNEPDTSSPSTEAIAFAQWLEQERKWYLGKHPYQEGKYLYRGETKTLEDLYQVFKNKRTI
jgi:hypothetical protein